MDTIILLFIIITILMFVFSGRKEYSKLRQKEAARYFGGSLISQGDGEYEERIYTNGIAMVIDPKTKKPSFKKQAKMCDAALLY